MLQIVDPFENHFLLVMLEHVVCFLDKSLELPLVAVGDNGKLDNEGQHVKDRRR